MSKFLFTYLEGSTLAMWQQLDLTALTRFGKLLLTWIIILLIIVVASTFSLNLYRAGWFWPVKPVPNPPQMGNRLLIIAPHPDDEALSAAGIIQEAVKSGKTVKVVIMTNGDGYRGAVVANYRISPPRPGDYFRLGIERHDESIKALGLLGVPAENITFLGYPDGGLMRLWESSWDSANPLQGRTGHTFSPYYFGFERYAVYAGANVVSNLAQILQEYNPTDLLYPDGNDQHNDHWAASAFTQYAVAKTKYRGQEWRYLVHLGEYPWPWQYTPSLLMHPPEAMKELGLQWASYRLDEAKVQTKKSAIEQYATQIKLMGSYMEGFVRKNELLIIDESLVLRPNSQIQVRSPASNKVFTNNYTDAGLRAIIEGKTIKRLHVENGDKTVAFVLETRGLVKAGTQYKLNLRFFRDHQVQRLDLEVQNNELTAKLHCSESIVLPQDTSLVIDDNKVRVELPQNSLQGVNSILFFGETKEGGRRLDKTTCTLVQIVDGQGDEK